MIIRSKHFQYPIKKQHKQEKILKELGLTDAFELSHDPFITSSPCHCFVCEEKLTIPAIMWNGFEPWKGAGDELWLQPNCVRQLVSGLLKDVDALEKGGSGH